MKFLNSVCLGVRICRSFVIVTVAMEEDGDATEDEEDKDDLTL